MKGLKSNRKQKQLYAKKQKLLNEIRQGLKEVKEIREGKAKAYSVSDLFDDTGAYNL